MDLHKISRWFSEAIIASILAAVFLMIEFFVYKLTTCLSGWLNFSVHFLNSFFMLSAFLMIGYSCARKSKSKADKGLVTNWMLLLLISVVVWYFWLADSFFLDN